MVDPEKLAALKEFLRENNAGKSFRELLEKSGRELNEAFHRRIGEYEDRLWNDGQRRFETLFGGGIATVFSRPDGVVTRFSLAPLESRYDVPYRIKALTSERLADGYVRLETYPFIEAIPYGEMNESCAAIMLVARAAKDGFVFMDPKEDNIAIITHTDGSRIPFIRDPGSLIPLDPEQRSRNQQGFFEYNFLRFISARLNGAELEHSDFLQHAAALEKSPQAYLEFLRDHWPVPDYPWEEAQAAFLKQRGLTPGKDTGVYPQEELDALVRAPVAQQNPEITDALAKLVEGRGFYRDELARFVAAWICELDTGNPMPFKDYLASTSMPPAIRDTFISPTLQRWANTVLASKSVAPTEHSV